MSISNVLAELTIHTPQAAIPQSNRDAAAKMLLDTCACAFVAGKLREFSSW